MANYTDYFNARKTEQTEKIAGKAQVKNSAGGYVFQLGDWDRLERFLILGCEGGSYYANAKQMTLDNAEVVMRCLQQNGLQTVDCICRISFSGRAPKNDAAIFALAMCSVFGDNDTKQRAHARIREVCRIPTHLFAFLRDCKALGKYSGRGIRTAISNWYNNAEPATVAYQCVKYRQRHGWTHKDVLRIGHPKGRTEEHQAVFKYLVGGERDERFLAFDVFNRLQNAESAKESAKIIERWKGTACWEMVKTEHLNEPDVWSVLLPNMPITALIRNLGKMTSVGAIGPLSDNAALVVDKLSNTRIIESSKIHPITVLIGLNTYSNGKGFKGSLNWRPVNTIEAALDDLFYASFGNVDSTGKRWLLGLDVSGSMQSWGFPFETNSKGAHVGGLSPMQITAAMAMVTARTETNYQFLAFSHQLVDCNITAADTLHSAVKKMTRIPMGGTDCSLPMLWAAENKVPVDVFAVYTDNETWAGRMHPCQAVKAYRKEMQRDAKVAVVGITATEFSIADPDDPRMMDFVGFDSAVPVLMADFAVK